MVNLDDDINDDENEESKTTSRKKILIFLLPVLIVIGLSVGFYHTFGKSNSNQKSNSPVSVVNQQEINDGKTENKTVVVYDLPELQSHLLNNEGLKDLVSIKITIEMDKIGRAHV